MGEYYELLKQIQHDIQWKIVLTGDDKTVLNQHQTGFFEEMTQTECRMHVRSIESLQYATPTTVGMLVSGLLEDAERVINPALFRQARSRIIGFQNGVFDLQIGKMRQYTSSDFVLMPLPHTIPERIDQDVEKWFMGVLSEWVTPEVSDWFADVLAYFLFIHPNAENLWMNFFEAGRNGKSSCLKLLEKIVGDDKAIGADLAHINRFSNATFQGKWLILGRDSSAFVSEGATSFIKNYSGDEKALVEVKGGNSFDTYTTGKIIVSTNNLIQSKDRSFGWYRRLIPVPFPNRFDLNEDFERALFKQIPQIIRILLHRAYCYRQNKLPVSQYLPEPVAKLKEETRYLNDRVVAFWELNFFEKVMTDKGLRPAPIVEEFLKIHNKPMSTVYRCYENWHHSFFGDGAVEPSLKSFGGPYGAFLTHAKEYFLYTRKRDGRYIELHKDKLDEFIGHLEPQQQECFYHNPDAWQMPD